MKKKVRLVIERLLANLWFQKIWAIYVSHSRKYSTDRYQQPYILSHRKDKKKYYVLRYVAPSYGIFAVARNALLECEWVEENGMIPIVDFEWEFFYEEKGVGHDNMWEYIFESTIPAQKINREKNVFVGGISLRNTNKKLEEKLMMTKKVVSFADDDWKNYYKILNLYSNKWWKLNNDIEKRYKEKYSLLFKPNMKILGVSLREEFSMGKDEIRGTTLGKHPHQPSLDEMIAIIKEYKEKWQCSHIFLTTYMQDSIDRIKKEFGDCVIYTDRRRVEFNKWKQSRRLFENHMKDEKSMGLYEWMNSEDEYARIINTYDKETMVEYVEEVYGLALCDCLLAGKSGGALAACIWNGGRYENIEILPDSNNSKKY